MNTLTKLALGLMGHNTPRPPTGTPLQARSLPSPRREGGLPLMESPQGFWVVMGILVACAGAGVYMARGLLR